MASARIFREAYSALRPKVDSVPVEPLSPAALVVLRSLPAEREKPIGPISLAQALGLPDLDHTLLNQIEAALFELQGRGLAQRSGWGWTR